MASTVATLFALVVALTFLSITIVGVAPQQQKNAEWLTSEHDLQQLEVLRSMATGPLVAGSSFSVPFSLGTPAASPFASSSDGVLAYDTNDPSGMSLSFSFVPALHQAGVTKINQDVVLLMDDSGSMARNDPTDLRIAGAKEYVSHLTPPDCVAIVAFNGRSYLTLTNVGGPAHHMNSPAMCGVPDYSLPQSDLDTITDVDSTNIGLAISTGNNELVTYGQHGKAYVEILLTDGQNECAGSASPCGDAYTISMAQAAKAANITIYTIGLSNAADGPLLSRIASITGGTYYAAPNASSIRWIYYEISMHYLTYVQCSTFSVAEAYGGAFSLQLNSNVYTPQTMRFESGGIAVSQSGGDTMYEGLPLVYTPVAGYEGEITVPVLAVTGTPFRFSGIGTHVVQASVLARDVVAQDLGRVDLGTEASIVAGIAANVTSWANQGAATQTAAAAVNGPLNLAVNELTGADANASSGDIVDAKFGVDRAQSDLSAAINAAIQQQQAGAMQAWLAQLTEDAIRAEACHISQWENWYNGVTITVTSPMASAWAAWFNATFGPLKVNFSVGLAANVAVVTIHSLDRITTDRRVLSLSSL